MNVRILEMFRLERDACRLVIDLDGSNHTLVIRNRHEGDLRSWQTDTGALPEFLARHAQFARPVTRLFFSILGGQEPMLPITVEPEGRA
jgi:hypothetical protein